ncbi:DUF2290 domain-containing protein [Tamlana sp. I1]|uniref:DUF2290 domain-containing protein n=1 Tax=Tamlana sp. I1 TaxID=2762061 RepID=UPI00188DDE81|nr:DUF2290 domain-containing protein [Tamlana sp. I1]
MTEANFNISFSKIEKTLKSFNLFKMRGIKNLKNDGVTDEFKKASLGNKYFEAYKTGLENYDFDFLLDDESYFQFQFSIKEGILEIRYSFFQNPFEHLTYEEYLANEIDLEEIEESIESIGNLFEMEYNQFLNEQDLSSNYSTIRYDSDFKNYKPILHSVSHIHIGHLSNIRIPIDKILSPLRFVLFTIKHIYYHNWKDKLENNKEELMSVLTDCVNGEQNLENQFWDDEEKIELHLR